MCVFTEIIKKNSLNLAYLAYLSTHLSHLSVNQRCRCVVYGPGATPKLRQKSKNKLLIGRPAKSANQRPIFLAGKCLNSCPDSSEITTGKYMTHRHQNQEIQDSVATNPFATNITLQKLLRKWRPSTKDHIRFQSKKMKTKV